MHESYHLYLCLERQKQRITIADLQATFLHGVAAIAIVYFNEYFFIICKFSLRIAMNYMENVAELLANVQKADTRCFFSDFFFSGMRLAIMQWRDDPVLITLPS